MKQEEESGFLGAIVAGLVFLFLFALLLSVWIFTAFGREFGRCVPLKNGLNLGYEALFDLRGTLFKPIAVPRFADGTPLVRDALWALYVTDTTVFGDTMANESEGGYVFAWRADTGRVLGRDNQALYSRLVAEAGPANWNFGPGSFGAGYLLDKLLKRPGFQGHNCPIALVTW